MAHFFACLSCRSVIFQIHIENEIICSAFACLVWTNTRLSCFQHSIRSESKRKRCLACARWMCDATDWSVWNQRQGLKSVIQFFLLYACSSGPAAVVLKLLAALCDTLCEQLSASFVRLLWGPFPFSLCSSAGASVCVFFFFFYDKRCVFWCTGWPSYMLASLAAWTEHPGARYGLTCSSIGSF